MPGYVDFFIDGGIQLHLRLFDQGEIHSTFKQAETLIYERKQKRVVWKKNRQSIISGDNSINLLAERDLIVTMESKVPTEIIDEKIKEEVEKLRKSRFFSEFDCTGSSLRFGKRLVEGDFSVGSDEVRVRGLAWCARFLSRSEELERAEEFLEVAKSLGDSPETKIAESFVFSQKGDKATALHILAGIDSDKSRSAGLMIVAHHNCTECALQWMNIASYTAEDLDSDGKNVLLSYQLQLGHSDNAAQTVSTFSEIDFEDTPILHHLVALTKLVATVPSDFRAVVLAQVPFEAANFSLASDAVAMDMRRAAHGHFLKAAEAAKQISCPVIARLDDEYALWLELRDPELSAHGKDRLEGKLRDPNTALRFVQYALQFGINLDLEAVERDIERNFAVNGGMTMDAAIARFALAFTKSTPEEVANYIARHHNQLTTHIDPKIMQFRQIEMLSRAGLIERANMILDQFLEAGLPAEEERVLRSIITEAQGNDPVESRKAHYEATGDLGDLLNLVTELEDHRHWDDVCDFGRCLFEETHSLEDARRLVNAFNNTHRSKDLVEFLKANSDLLSQSRYLQMSHAWGLYNEGLLLESRVALAKLSDDSGSSDYRALQVNLGIAMGDWASLSVYLASEYQNRHSRSAHDLVGAAQLALHLGSPHAKDLVFEAASKAEDDAAILVGTYFLATSAGWENDPKVYQWLERAAELSDDDGPLQRISLRDIIERKPEWDRRESESWRLLGRGETPIFIAAQSLNRTLINLTAFPALANLSEHDPRRRSAVPAYSGKRELLEFDISIRTVALDATALLTLSFLKILSKTLDTFETVYIPHSTLMWLFEERQNAVFHQPSRIQNARKVRDLLSMNVLEKFVPSTVANSNLSVQVGDELAALIAEAEKVREGDNTQHVVVRSAPVHHLSSLMEEEVDLSAHASVLSSCLNVVSKLRQKAQITAEEEKRAYAYLQLHEKPWPNQPEISDGATLYLDDLAITYLLHIGLLEKLKDAGLRAVASPREISEVDALIAYGHLSDEVIDIIERIRDSLNSRIESGRVRVSSRHKFDEVKENSISDHPTIDILALAPQCDAVIVDDRFINQHRSIDSGGTLTPVLCSLDVLDALAKVAVISGEERREYRTRLRRAGFFFVPICEEELEWCLRNSVVVDGNVVETAELKAIRESILRVRMSDWLQLPDEAPWLDATLKAFIRVLKNLWEDGADIDEITARSNWLANQVDIRGWAHSLDPENADDVVRIGRGTHILLLLVPPTGVQQGYVEVYWNWVEEKILVPIKDQFPDLYASLVEWYRHQVTEIAKTELSEGGES